MIYAFHGNYPRLSVIHADSDEEAVQRFNSEYRRTVNGNPEPVRKVEFQIRQRTWKNITKEIGAI